jgi:hypothetical protein
MSTELALVIARRAGVDVVNAVPNDECTVLGTGRQGWKLRRCVRW